MYFDCIRVYPACKVHGCKVIPAGKVGNLEQLNGVASNLHIRPIVIGKKMLALQAKCTYGDGIIV